MGFTIKEINEKDQVRPGPVGHGRRADPAGGRYRSGKSGIKPLRAGILGCTGIVGQHFLRLLRRHPYFEIAGLFASARSIGKNRPDLAVGANAPPLPVCEATAEAVIGHQLDLVFSALPAAVAGPLETTLAAQGLAVFSNASAHRLDANVPLLIADVNPSHLRRIERTAGQGSGFIVSNSNCCVSGLALAIKPLVGYGIRSLTVSTYQAISGAGRGGLAAWDISGNLVPFIAGEEEKIGRELNIIIAPALSVDSERGEIEVQANCCRVPIRDGHLQSVVVELHHQIGLRELTAALASYRSQPQRLKLPTAPRYPIIIRPEIDRPQPLLDLMAGTPPRAAGMAVSVGRLRRHSGKLSFFLLVHNLIRGAAGTCILNAELAWRLGFLRSRGKR